MPDSKDFALMAMVQWNKEGRIIIAEKEYKFFSPEFSMSFADPEDRDIEHGPTLLGGAFTNQPFFKGLKPIVASTKNISKILSKKEMSKTKKIEEKEKGSEIKLSLKEYQKLTKDSEDHKKMSIKLAKMEKEQKLVKMGEVVKKFIFSDKNTEAVFLPKKGLQDELVKFMASLSVEQIEKFNEILEMSTTKIDLFAEQGVEGKKTKKASTKNQKTKDGQNISEESLKLDAKAEELMASTKGLDYADAMVQAETELASE